MIVCSDLHLQITPPRCRTENEEQWLAYQRKMLQFLVSTANEHDTDLYIAGDITDKAITSPLITTMFINEMNKLKGLCYIMPGNHCLPNHSLLEMDKANYGILNAIAGGEGKIKTIDQSGYAYVPYGKTEWLGRKHPKILFVHRLVFESEATMPPSTEAITTAQLLDLYPEPRIMVTGDNHSTFVCVVGDRVHINCGCTTKRTIDFQDKDLAIYMINADIWDVRMIKIPDDSILVRDAHVEAQKENEEKFKALVDLLKDTGAMTLDYVANLQAKMGVLAPESKKVLEEVL
jgi:hypothetical protein